MHSLSLRLEVIGLLEYVSIASYFGGSLPEAALAVPAIQAEVSGVAEHRPPAINNLSSPDPPLELERVLVLFLVR